MIMQEDPMQQDTMEPEEKVMIERTLMELSNIFKAGRNNIKSWSRQKDDLNTEKYSIVIQDTITGLKFTEERKVILEQFKTTTLRVFRTYVLSKINEDGINEKKQREKTESIPEPLFQAIHYLLKKDVLNYEEINIIFDNFLAYTLISPIKTLQILFYYIQYDLEFSTYMKILQLIVDDFLEEDISLDSITRPLVVQIIDSASKKDRNEASLLYNLLFDRILNGKYFLTYTFHCLIEKDLDVIKHQFCRFVESFLEILMQNKQLDSECLEPLLRTLSRFSFMTEGIIVLLRTLHLKFNIAYQILDFFDSVESDRIFEDKDQGGNLSMYFDIKNDYHKNIGSNETHKNSNVVDDILYEDNKDLINTSIYNEPSSVLNDILYEDSKGLINTAIYNELNVQDKKDIQYFYNNKPSLSYQNEDLPNLFKGSDQNNSEKTASIAIIELFNSTIHLCNHNRLALKFPKILKKFSRIKNYFLIDLISILRDKNFNIDAKIEALYIFLRNSDFPSFEGGLEILEIHHLEHLIKSENFLTKNDSFWKCFFNKTFENNLLNFALEKHEIENILRGLNLSQFDSKKELVSKILKNKKVLESNQIFDLILDFNIFAFELIIEYYGNLKEFLNVAVKMIQENLTVDSILSDDQKIDVFILKKIYKNIEHRNINFETVLDFVSDFISANSEETLFDLIFYKPNIYVSKKIKIIDKIKNNGFYFINKTIEYFKSQNVMIEGSFILISLLNFSLEVESFLKILDFLKDQILNSNNFKIYNLVLEFLINRILVYNGNNIQDSHCVISEDDKTTSLKKEKNMNDNFNITSNGEINNSWSKKMNSIDNFMETDNIIIDTVKLNITGNQIENNFSDPNQVEYINWKYAFEYLKSLFLISTTHYLNDAFNILKRELQNVDFIDDDHSIFFISFLSKNILLESAIDCYKIVFLRHTKAINLMRNRPFWIKKTDFLYEEYINSFLTMINIFKGSDAYALPILKQILKIIHKFNFEAYSSRYIMNKENKFYEIRLLAHFLSGIANSFPNDCMDCIVDMNVKNDHYIGLCFLMTSKWLKGGMEANLALNTLNNLYNGKIKGEFELMVLGILGVLDSAPCFVNEHQNFSTMLSILNNFISNLILHGNELSRERLLKILESFKIEDLNCKYSVLKIDSGFNFLAEFVGENVLDSVIVQIFKQIVNIEKFDFSKAYNGDLLFSFIDNLMDFIINGLDNTISQNIPRLFNFLIKIVNLAEDFIEYKKIIYILMFKLLQQFGGDRDLENKLENILVIHLKMFLKNYLNAYLRSGFGIKRTYNEEIMLLLSLINSPKYFRIINSIRRELNDLLIIGKYELVDSVRRIFNHIFN